MGGSNWPQDKDLPFLLPLPQEHNSLLRTLLSTYYPSPNTTSHKPLLVPGFQDLFQVPLTNPLVWPGTSSSSPK